MLGREVRRGRPEGPPRRAVPGPGRAVAERALGLVQVQAIGNRGRLIRDSGAPIGCGVGIHGELAQGIRAGEGHAAEADPERPASIPAAQDAVSKGQEPQGQLQLPEEQDLPPPGELPDRRPGQAEREGPHGLHMRRRGRDAEDAHDPEDGHPQPQLHPHVPLQPAEQLRGGRLPVRTPHGAEGGQESEPVVRRHPDRQAHAGELQEQDLPIRGADQAGDAPDQDPRTHPAGEEQAPHAHEADPGEAAGGLAGCRRPRRRVGAAGRPEQESEREEPPEPGPGGEEVHDIRRDVREARRAFRGRRMPGPGQGDKDPAGQQTAFQLEGEPLARALRPIVPDDEGAEHDQQREPELPHATELGLGEDPPEDAGGQRVHEGLPADECRLGAQPPEGRDDRGHKGPPGKTDQPPLKGARPVAPLTLGMAEGRSRHEKQEGKEPDEQREAPYVDDARSGEEERHGATVNEKFPSVTCVSTERTRQITL